MNRSYKKIIFFVLIFFALDFSIGISFERFRERNVGNVKRAKKTIDDFYNYKKNIDVLFLGSSHAYRSFDPRIFDQRLCVNSFNLGTSGQNPVISYFLYKESMRIGHNVKLLIIDIYFKAISGEDNDYDSSLYVYKYLNFSLNKVNMFTHAFAFPSSLKVLSKIYNNRNAVELWALPHLGEKVDASDKTSVYGGIGYWESDKIVSENELKNNEFRGTKVSLNEHRLNYLNRIIETALKKGCKVLLVSSPIPPTSFREIVNYETFYKKLSGLAKSFKIDFIDYNVENIENRLFDDKHFMDDDHLNKYGVAIYNDILIRFLITNKKYQIK